MSLEEDYRIYLRAFARGQESIEALRDWLADHVQDVAGSGDSDVERLDAEAWILLSEYDYGHRQESQVRQAIADALAHRVHLVRGG